jgi:16S rRNA (uracil1498-N3)-methyltransferase
MARYDFTTHRLHIEAPLAAGAVLELPRAKAHYLTNVLRLPAGAEILTFNGEDGEWRCALSTGGRKTASLTALVMTRPQPAALELIYAFAPLKHARLDYMVQKSVEMGAGVLQPILTRHTHVERLNVERMQSNAIEAAEQCGILTLPHIAPIMRLDAFLANWPAERLLVFCDEDAEGDPLSAFAAVKAAAAEAGATKRPSPAVLVGPEGGFDKAERQQLLALRHVVRLSLGPRILRADTAAVAALALTQAALGDWRI